MPTFKEFCGGLGVVASLFVGVPVGLICGAGAAIGAAIDDNESPGKAFAETYVGVLDPIVDAGAEAGQFVAPAVALLGTAFLVGAARHAGSETMKEIQKKI